MKSMVKVYPWSLSPEEVAKLVRIEQIEHDATIHPCGCGIKLDLEEVIYPILKNEMENGILGIGERVDSTPISGRLTYRGREVFSIDETSEVSDGSSITPNVVAALVSLDRHFYTDPTKSRDLFGRSLKSLVRRASFHHASFSKAHTIEAGGNFVSLDIFRVQSDPSVFTFINNDTIVTADSLLRPDSRLSVRISLANALNDLMVTGVTRDIRVYPTIDGSDESVNKIWDELNLAIEEYRKLGIEITLDGRVNRSLSVGTVMVGATVTGVGTHRATAFGDLQPGSVIFVSRNLGDLSVLALHRNEWLAGKEPGNVLKGLRTEVLRRMSAPQFEIGKLVQRHLGHGLEFVTDLSGPGLSVLFEAAEASGVDINVETIRFHDENLLHHYRRNHTSGTNGPILFACSPIVAEAFAEELRSVVGDEVWRLGTVGGRSEEPTMILNPTLQRFVNDKEPRFDVFLPEVHFSEEKRRIPIFKHYRFE